MDDSRHTQNQKYLAVTKLENSELEQLYQKEEHAVWKTLIKVEQSKRMSDIPKAINEIRVGRSFIINYTRNTSSSKNQQMYNKALIHCLTTMTNYLVQHKNYQQAFQTFKQLYSYIDDSTMIKQAIYNMFGFNSILALSNYNTRSNAEFKCNCISIFLDPSDTQLLFLYAVAKCKYVTGHQNDAKAVLEKIFVLAKSVQISQYLLIRVYDMLAQLQPFKYKSECQKFSKVCPSHMLLSAEEKSIGYEMMKMLLVKEKSLLQQISMTNKPKINRTMLKLYLNKALKDYKSLNLSQNYVKSLIQTFQKQNNQFVINEILQSSPISTEVQKLFTKNISKINQIVIAYYFRKLLPSNKSVLKNEYKNNLSKISEKESAKQKSGMIKKIIRIPSSVPRDQNRAQLILKKCGQGNFVNKINYGNSSIVRRYIRIQEKALVWGKNQQDADYSSSSCKWKYVLGLTYGRVSQNLSKLKFSHLQPWKCFSLITEDRSYDFCCEDQSDIFFWLQGISYKLQLFHGNENTYPYYSKGRALWKMSLLKMKQQYKDPKLKHYCKNAGAIINFKKLRSK